MRTSIVVFFISYLAIIFAFNNCSAVHQASSELSSFEACNLILKDQFIAGYHNFLQTNCNNCHSSGGTGNGAFADSNVDTAFDAFLVRGNTLVGDRAKDPNHQPPYSGAQHTAEVDDMDTTWDAAKVQVDQCVINSGGSNGPTDIDDGIIPTGPRPTQGTVTTYIKLTGANPDGQNITWDLGDEIATSGVSFPGAQLSVRVTAITTVNGEKSYSISQPRLRAGDQALQIDFIEFIINNEVVEDATSYHGISRKVAANQTEDLAGGAALFAYDLRNTDSIAISIGVLEAINFNPPTFAELIAPNGVFGQHCLSCHDAATARGGLDMSTRDGILQQLMVAPYSPNSSEIFKRMNDVQRPMPQAGILPAAELLQVQQWIENGAR